ncbi:unnamed protein product [Mytilus edulis]|uniref:Integrase catalytic domain-containing protein n=1 Tax=Mytilus edulis TaxID=6550 RepID=A0A8S3SK53_MYTED|nr:unnamed protein product [Mytilus edulis]
MLYIRWENARKEEYKLKMVVPRKLVNEILYNLHTSPLGGHLGVSKTFGKVSERFYWFGMRRDVENYVANCVECVTRKNPSRTARAPLQPHYSGAPFEKIAIDILEVPMSDQGNRFIVVIGDYFSKWAEAFPLKNHTAPVIAEILIDQFISRFGAPFQLHSDQGPEFESRLISELCKLLGIDKTRTTTYHPQSDGQVERFNRTLLSMLSKYVKENQRDWDVHLQKVMMGYRTSEHESTKFSPAYVLFGRELRLPLDVQYQLPDGSTAKNASEYVTRTKERFLQAYEVVRENLGLSQKTMKDHYDRKAFGEAFDVGDKVWYYDPRVKKGRSPKLNRPWKGPYTIKKKISDLVYRIQLDNTRMRKVVHFNKLKKCAIQKRNNQHEITTTGDDICTDVDEEEQPANRQPFGGLDINFQPTPPASPITNNREERLDEDVSNEDEDETNNSLREKQVEDLSEEEREDAVTDNGNLANETTPIVEETHMDDTEETTGTALRRSSRNRKKSKYFEDFVLGDGID